MNANPYVTDLAGRSDLAEDPIRRYMTLSNFQRLVDTGRLWFAPLTSMEQVEMPDLFEGHLPREIADKWNRWWVEKRLPEVDGRSDPNLSEKMRRRQADAYAAIDAQKMTDTFRHDTAVSCWARGEESLPMWSVYGERARGVALVSSTRLLVEGFREYLENSDASLIVDRVKYHRLGQLRRLRMGTLNPLSIGFIKRPAFAWESELRIAFTSAHGKGHGLRINLATSVSEVVVGPMASKRRVNAIRRMIPASLPVRQSDLLLLETWG